MNTIRINDAFEANLKHISLEIPRNKLVVFTGVSGSGKTTLLVDVLFKECQRQYLEALSLEGLHKPKVDSVRGASPAVYIAQDDANRNPRSTVGTLTDVYTDLRMVFEKLAARDCPHCGALISSADCREATLRAGDEFHVYMDCSRCGGRMDKLTRTHFSFNTAEGACPGCQGLGKVHSIRREKLVNESLTLEDGAAACWQRQYKDYQIAIFNKALGFYGIPVQPGLPVSRFSQAQKLILYEGTDSEGIKRLFPGHQPPAVLSAGKFEGLIPFLWRRLAEKKGDAAQFEAYFDIVTCPQCQGERLGPLSRKALVNDTRLPQLSNYSLEKLSRWADELCEKTGKEQKELIAPYLRDIRTKLNRFIKAGIAYLSLDRQAVTLSGGELQRLRLAAMLDSELTGIICILDEPTAGLHPRDTAGLIDILLKLRDKGNSVLVIEHDMDVMAAADYLVDMGPGAGKHGGGVVAAGTLEQIRLIKDSPTGSFLFRQPQIKERVRPAKGSLRIRDARDNNLRCLSLDIPLACLTAVTGPSGSGKTTLVFQSLTSQLDGQAGFDRVALIEQSPIYRMKRSTVATYTGLYADIRSVFAQSRDAKDAGLKAKDFSFNSPGGRCERCEGMGYVGSQMLFFADTQQTCPACRGKRFEDRVLAVRHRGLSINEVLNLQADEAAAVFQDKPGILRVLKLLEDVGLGYLQLGQSLDILSSGEGQRLKLAWELIAGGKGRQTLYLMDEPTRGLHPQDIEHFLRLLDRLADAGNTVVVVEHSQQLIRHCDWVIDLGPEGGDRGGEVVFQGTPGQLKEEGKTLTARYL